MKRSVVSAVAFIALTTIAHAEDPVVWRGATMLECSPISFQPEERGTDKDPVYKILIGVDVDSKMNVRGMMVEHYTAFGKAYSRGNQYKDIRFATSTEEDVKFLKWGGLYKKAAHVTMVGYLFFNESRWHYSEKTADHETGETKLMDAICHETGNTELPSP